MTYHFLIVDDEYYVRQRIRLCIPWQDYGFECAGEAANADQALEFVRLTAVDLVLVDISMPGPNGLELIRMLRQKNPSLKFVILSGFSTFEYARQAISCGVVNYLLKPINTEELIQTVREIKKDLDHNRRLKQEQLAYDEARHVAESAERGSFFQAIFSNQLPVVSLEELRDYGIQPEKPCTVLVIDGLPSDLHKLTFPEQAAFRQGLSNLASQPWAAGRGGVLTTDMYRHQVLILPGNTLDQAEQLVESLSQTAKELLSKELVCGYGLEPDSSPKAIAAAYYKAMQFFTFQTIYNSKAAHFYDALPEKQVLDHLSYLTQSVKSSLLKKDSQAILSDIHAVFSVIWDKLLSLPALESQLSSLLSIAMEYAVTFSIELFGENGRSAATAAEIIHGGGCLAEIEEKMCNLFLSLLSGQEEEDLPMIHRIVLQAAELIDREYSNFDMGLQYIASVLLISPAYLSRNFKRIKSQSVMQYITKRRMEHAWDMLHGTDLSISRIAEQAGYQDSFYFSKRFKQYFGMAPSQIDRVLTKPPSVL